MQESVSLNWGEVMERRFKRTSTEWVPIERLRPFEGNPRKIGASSLEKLRRSIEEFGFTNPILAQRGADLVIAGHQRLKATQAAGLREVPVIYNL